MTKNDNTISTEDKKQQLSVKIFSPFEVFYEGPAYSLSARTQAGPFDVLYDHANFISLVLPGKVAVQTPFGNRNYNITRGILKVHNNYAVLFANI
jgi:F0F1-type ATP synthase epsilon subunit